MMVRMFWPYVQVLALTLAPVAAGAMLARRGLPRKTARPLFSAAIYVCQPALTLLAVWNASLAGRSVWLPVLVLAGWLGTTAAGRLFSGPLRHTPAQRGAFIVTMCISNHGYSMLGLIALLLFGQKGLSQATYAQFCVVPFLVLVCFPLGRFYGQGQGQMPLRALLARSLADPRNLPLLAMIAGLLLNIWGPQRPASATMVIHVLVYAGTIITGLAVGLLLRGAMIRKFARENAVSFLWRGTAFPLLYYGLACLAGLSTLDRRILVLFGLVPPGLFATLVADFFDLDTDLTTSVFIVGTVLFLVLVLPLYAWAVMVH